VCDREDDCGDNSDEHTSCGNDDDGCCKVIEVFHNNGDDEVYNTQRSIFGIYELQPEKSGGKAHWIKGGRQAIWFSERTDEWLIGKKERIGESRYRIASHTSTHTCVNQIGAFEWSYYNPGTETFLEGGTGLGIRCKNDLDVPADSSADSPPDWPEETEAEAENYLGAYAPSGAEDLGFSGQEQDTAPPIKKKKEVNQMKMSQFIAFPF